MGKKKTVTVDFFIDEKVEIIELEIKAVVKKINITKNGLLYYVRYFYNCEIKTAWLFANELKSL